MHQVTQVERPFHHQPGRKELAKPLKNHTVGNCPTMKHYYWLVVYRIPTPLINDGVRQWEGLSHRLWKIKFMFETTNQTLIFHYQLVNHH